MLDIFCKVPVKCACAAWKQNHIFVFSAGEGEEFRSLNRLVGLQCIIFKQQMTPKRIPCPWNKVTLVSSCAESEWGCFDFNTPTPPPPPLLCPTWWYRVTVPSNAAVNLFLFQQQQKCCSVTQRRAAVSSRDQQRGQWACAVLHHKQLSVLPL